MGERPPLFNRTISRRELLIFPVAMAIGAACSPRSQKKDNSYDYSRWVLADGVDGDEKSQVWLSGFEKEMIENINNLRTGFPIAPLAVDETLTYSYSSTEMMHYFTMLFAQYSGSQAKIEYRESVLVVRGAWGRL